MAIANDVLSTAPFCDPDLPTDIMRDLRCDVASMEEADLMGAINGLAVKKEGTLVHRIQLNRMTQSSGTAIRTFLVSLRCQAPLCQYRAKCKVPRCTYEFYYSNEVTKNLSGALLTLKSCLTCLVILRRIEQWKKQ